MWKAMRQKLGCGKSIGCYGSMCRPRRHSAATDPVSGDGRANLAEQIGEMELPGAAAALEEEVNLVEERQPMEAGKTPLMMLMEEEEEEEEEEERGEEAGIGGSCCICMGKKKGAALVPCGHAFCRSCARELWIGRRSCALCNRPILEILDIF